MSENKDTRTATQKIEDLERVVTALYQAAASNKNALEVLFRSQSDMGLIKEALKLLNKKTEAIIQTAAPETGITVAAVSAIVLKMNVEELKNQVEQYVANGHLTSADTVAADSYVVGEELNTNGGVVNPRTQFRIDAQDEATVAALTGKKAGDTASLGENRFSIKILEVYTIKEQSPDAASTSPEAPVSAPAETAPAETPAPTEAAPAEAPAAVAAPLPELPAETPVVQFVPSDASTMMTAS